MSDAGQLRASVVAVRDDLPLLPAGSPAQRAQLRERRAELRRRLLQQTGGSLAVGA